MAATQKRIMVDASMLPGGGGGYTFLTQLFPEMARRSPEHRFRVSVRNPRLADALDGYDNIEVDKLPAPNPWERFRFTYFDGARHADEWNADLYFSCADYAPLKAPCPVVASAQNMNVYLGHAKLREIWGIKQQARLNALNRLAWLSARTVDAVHYVSEFSARHMGDAVGVEENRRIVVPLGVRPSAAPPTGRPGDLRGGFALSVGSIYPYKNYEFLIRAYSALLSRRPEAPDLVIAGGDLAPATARAMEEARLASGQAERIHLVGEVPHAEIGRYYENADLYLFPSYLESFGIPLIEAMAAEVPIVASDLDIFHELADDAALYVGPQDQAGWVEAMEAALFRPLLREQLAKNGRKRAQRYCWGRSADDMLVAFDRVIAQKQPNRVSAPLPLRGARAAA